jgi:hypothetical protein
MKQKKTNNNSSNYLQLETIYSRRTLLMLLQKQKEIILQNNYSIYSLNKNSLFKQQGKWIENFAKTNFPTTKTENYLFKVRLLYMYVKKAVRYCLYTYMIVGFTFGNIGTWKQFRNRRIDYVQPQDIYFEFLLISSILLIIGYFLYDIKFTGVNYIKTNNHAFLYYEFLLNLEKKIKDISSDAEVRAMIKKSEAVSE